MSKISSVRARRLTDNSEHTMPLKAWNYVKGNLDDRNYPVFEIIGYTVTSFDANGNASNQYFTGDPNSHTQLKEVQAAQAKQNAAPAVSVQITPGSVEAPKQPGFGYVPPQTQPEPVDTIKSLSDIVPSEQPIEQDAQVAPAPTRRRGRPSERKIQEVSE